MTAIQLKDVINQLEKYNLICFFKTKEELNKWLIGLTPKQINNFLRLNVNPQNIAESGIGKILIYKNSSMIIFKT